MKVFRAAAVTVGAGAVLFVSVNGGLSSGNKAAREDEDPTIFNRNNKFGDQVAQRGGANAGIAPTNGTPGVDANGQPLQPGQGTDSLSGAMNSMVGQSTAGVPGTGGGNYACAYGVNAAYQQMTGNTITGAYGSGSNLSVADTLTAIRNSPGQFQQVDAQTAISSGKDYIIVSNGSTGSNGSHIGVGNGSTVWSNSSSQAAIAQNYSTSSWQNHFGGTQYYVVNH